MKTDENEHVRILSGSEHDLIEALKDAQTRKAKYAFRHVVFNPDEFLEKGEFGILEKLYRNEFGANAPILIVQHMKGRAGFDVEGAGAHFHVVYAECLENGRILDSRYSKRRNEKVARDAEYRFHHRINLGKGTLAIIKAWRAEGKTEQARMLFALKCRAGEPAASAYSDRMYQISRRRNGKSMLPEMRADLRFLWKAYGEDFVSFVSIVKRGGYILGFRNRGNAYLVTDRAGNTLALHRVLEPVWKVS